MSAPVLLDLYCCQGGAGMGYHRAGFRVVGVDTKPQPRYPFEFVQADALAFLEKHGPYFDAVHASPPCQAFTTLRHLPTSRSHPNLIPATRELLDSLGKPYVIENVPGAPLLNPVVLCGTMFDLRTRCGAQLRRHRLFETNWLLMCGLVCWHGAHTCTVTGHNPENTGARKRNRKDRTITITGHSPYDPAKEKAKQRAKVPVISIFGEHARDRSAERQQCTRTITITGSTPQQNVVRNQERETFSVDDAREAMGIDWMGMKGLSQAIPPAYTEFIGRQLERILG